MVAATFGCASPDTEPEIVYVQGPPLPGVDQPAANASSTDPDVGSSAGSSTGVGPGVQPSTPLAPELPFVGEPVESPQPVGTASGEPNGPAPEPAQAMAMRGPTPAANGVNFPFPQNRHSEFCNYPTNYDNADVVAAFEKWKADVVTADGANGALRIRRLESDPVIQDDVHSTVSEGIAYGMLIAVYMGDQELFDGLWRYSQQWLNDTGLMHWLISSDGGGVLGSGAASDADEDIAWALVMADRQWGGNGSLDDTYLNLANTMIQRVWDHEIADGKLLLPGDSWGGWESVNVSYFMPNYYRVFAEVSGNQGWLDVVQTSYDTMNNSLNAENGNADNGLVPAWATSEGQPNGGVWGGGDAPTHYQYDSCRTPFRIGVDYCLRGEMQAYDYVQKTSAFFSGIGVANMTDGYDLNGTPRAQYSGLSAAFVGTAAVGAMSNPAYQQFLDDAYAEVRGLDLLVGGAYYDESWTVMSLLMMTGNFLDYTQLEPLLE